MNESTYELVDQIDPYTNEVTGQVLKRTDSDGVVWFIPSDPANSDYAAYLESLETPAPKAK
jgi:hypothetical protein